METALAESTALSSKSEREYITLRDSIKSMTESWKSDTDRLREEIKRREEKWKVEEQSMGKKYRLLVEEVQAAETARLQSVDLREENTRIGKELEEAWAEEISAMRTAMEKSNKDSEEANATAKCVVSTFRSATDADVAMPCRELAAELARLRRLMRTAGRAESEAKPS